MIQGKSVIYTFRSVAERQLRVSVIVITVISFAGHQQFLTVPGDLDMTLTDQIAHLHKYEEMLSMNYRIYSKID